MSIIEKAVEKAGDQKPKKNNSLFGNQADKDIQSPTETDSHESITPPASEFVATKPAESSSPAKVSKPQQIVNKITIDLDNLSKQGFLVSEDISLQMSEEYRIIKRPLVNNVAQANENGIKRPNLILITSSQPGEGKTFSAINLALSISREPDKQVLLIDADVAKPSISKIFGISESCHGLIDYLDGEELSFADMMLKTNISGLSLIPAGKRHGFSTELLASERMTMLTEELHTRYSDRIVIFDSPPLLAATQAEVLAGLVGQVVMVVEAENTMQNMVAEAIEKLKVCDVVLALLNKSKHSFDLNYYGYGQYGH